MFSRVFRRFRSMRWRDIRSNIRIRSFATICGFFALGNGASEVMCRVVFVKTRSVKAHFLWPAEGDIELMDYVTFDVDHPIVPNGSAQFTKLALCLQGQELTFDGHNFYCDGRWLHRVMEWTRDGQELVAFDWESGRIPNGYAYVGSHSSRGFDSRYLGFLPLSEIRKLRVLD